MCRQEKMLSIVTPICLILSGAVLLLCLISPDFIALEVYLILTTVLLTIWAFFIVPSVIYAIEWLLGILRATDDGNFTTGFARGFRFGYLWADLVFLLIILGAPVSGTLWFVDTVRGVRRYKREKAKSKDANKTDDEVFDI